MSWLGTLAAKTENLLNKVDQVAGQALQNSSFEGVESSSHVSSQWQLPPEIQSVSTYSPFLAQKPEKPLFQVSSGASLSAKNSKKDPDSELIEFLNGSQTTSAAKDSRPSSSASNMSSHSLGSDALEPFSSTPKVPLQKDFHPADTVETRDESTAHQQLAVENQLLKNEIHSLNREMQSMASRVQLIQEELNQTLRKMNKQGNQLSMGEQMVRELRERENDLTKTLEAKDTQLSVLRVRLEEADIELQAQKKRINQVLSEKDNILQDHTMSTGVQSHALETLQEKIREAEETSRRDQEHFHKEEEEFKRKLSHMESEKENLLVEFNNLQKLLSREKSSSSDMSNQLRSARSQAESARQELSQYKDKATRILQSKDRLIATLKEGSVNNMDGSGASEPIIHSSEMESLKQERDILKEDYHSSQVALENMRAELNELENQMQQESEFTKEQMRMLEGQMETEKRRREDAESEVNKQKQELKYVHEEVLKQKTAFQSRIQDREAEIQRLRNQLTTKSLNATSQEELENRLHTLTESLIQKQTAVESLSTEKSSLLLQLERMEKQYREAETSAMRNSSATVRLSADDDDVRPRLPNFMKESPFDGNVARKVKRAANTIDRFSIRLGVFLRRYPTARVFIIVYMFLLHLWVMIVMLTYQPEIHLTPPASKDTNLGPI